MGLSRQEYWSECHALFLGIFPTQGSKPHFLHWEEDSLPLSHQQNPKSSNWWLYTWPFLRLIDFINNTKITIPKGEESTPKNEWMNQKTNIWQKYNMSIHLPNVYWVCSTWQATYQDMGNRWNNETLSLARMSYLAEVTMYTNNSGA